MSTASSEPAKKLLVRPQAELRPGPNDEVLRREELLSLGFFGQLKKPPAVEKFPGSTLLRRFSAGSVICRQGEPGHSAFYILTTEDVLGLRQMQLDALRAAEPRGPSPAGAQSGRLAALEAEVAALRARVARLEGQPARCELRVAASARLPVEVPVQAQPRGWRRWLGLGRGAAAAEGPSARPRFIPNDGPTDIDIHTRRAAMYEGEVFGEMSCMTLAPRSASVVAETDCYLLEMLRNIFDQIQRDDGYRQQIDAVYSQRVLDGHLRRIDLFRDLDDESLSAVRRHVDLVIVEPGTVICDEHDPSDSVYVVRSGLVQVVKDVNVSLRETDVADLRELCRTLLTAVGETMPPAAAAVETRSPEEASATAQAPPPPAAEDSPSTPAAKAASRVEAIKARLAAKAAAKESGSDAAAPPPSADTPANAPVVKALPAALRTRAAAATVAVAPAATAPHRKIWQALGEEAQAAIRSVAGGAEDPSARQVIFRALNTLMRDRELLASKELADVFRQADVLPAVQTFPKGPAGVKRDWTELEVRIGGRVVLQSLFSGHLPARDAVSGPPRILAYLSRGDVFGEMGVVLNQPRSATCIAYDHPQDDPSRKAGRVELVQIEAEAFRSLLQTHPTLRRRVEELVTQRQQETATQLQRPAWDPRDSVLTSPEFRDAGFIQGQKLLLIDLDLCTRCGDCVRACVATHADGYSRLFLDGPRFDRFLVPSACRMCLNPACMIGCPVGSIQRGANGQILIRDWCIGCGLCARQCPYDSIQMHDQGIVPTGGAVWRVAPQSAAGANWHQPGHRDGGWAETHAPVRWTLDVQEALWGQAPGVWPRHSPRIHEPMLLRHTFQAPATAADDSLKLQLAAEQMQAEVWLNGQPISCTQDARQKKRGEAEAVFPATALRRGKNVLAVRLSPVAPRDEPTDTSPPRLPDGATLLSLRLDRISRFGGAVAEGVQAEVELVTDRAVVCDLCSELPGGPACVAQCPHEAAMRVDARFEFPLR